MAGAVARRPKVASGLAVVIAEGPAMQIARPKSAGFILRRVSTVSISRPPCGLGAFGLLGGRRLALHLFLRILRRRRDGRVRRRFRGESKSRYNSIQRFRVRVASSPEVYEAIHETFVQTITRFLAHNLSYLACVRSRQTP